MEIFSHLDSVYSMNVKDNYEQLAHYTSADAEMMKKCSGVSLRAWRALGAVDGGRIDLRFDRHDRLCFIEANPLAGLNPIHSDLPMLARMNNISYGQLIGMIMESATTRLKITR